MTITEPVQTAIRWWRNGDHPADAVGQEVPVPGPSGTFGETYRRQEGAVVRFFRHPDVDGTTVHETCGREWHVHGWIDQGPDGLIVCPGDLVIDCGSEGRDWWEVRSDLSAAERLIGEGVYLVSAADYDTEMPPEVQAWLTRARRYLPAPNATVEAEPAGLTVRSVRLVIGGAEHTLSATGDGDIAIALDGTTVMLWSTITDPPSASPPRWFAAAVRRRLARLRRADRIFVG